MMQRVRPLLRWLPALAWMAGIFLLSSQSNPPHPKDPMLARIAYTAAHFFVFGVLAALLLIPLRRRDTPGGDFRARMLAFAIAAVYGLSDEFHQAYVPYREPSLYDWLTDLAGASWALWVVSVVAGRARAGVRRFRGVRG